jgi:hypothetical protein
MGAVLVSILRALGRCLNVTMTIVERFRDSLCGRTGLGRAARARRNPMLQSAGSFPSTHSRRRQEGWFEADYFYPVRLGPFKKAAGALFDHTASRSAGA